MVEWGQVILDTRHMDVQEGPVDRSEVNQDNHDLVVLTSRNSFDENSVHESLDGTLMEMTKKVGADKTFKQITTIYHMKIKERNMKVKVTWTWTRWIKKYTRIC